MLCSLQMTVWFTKWQTEGRLTDPLLCKCCMLNVVNAVSFWFHLSQGVFTRKLTSYFLAERKKNLSSIKMKYAPRVLFVCLAVDGLHLHNYLVHISRSKTLDTLQLPNPFAQCFGQFKMIPSTLFVWRCLSVKEPRIQICVHHGDMQICGVFGYSWTQSTLSPVWPSANASTSLWIGVGQTSDIDRPGEMSGINIYW